MTQLWARTLMAVAIGSFGGMGAWLIGLPAPMLMGPALTVTAAAIAGVRLHMPVRLRDASFIVIGTGMGAGVTPETLEAMRTWPFSVVMLAVSIGAILLVGAMTVARLFGRDWRTATLAASPGHLSYVLGLGLDVRADVPFVTVVQSLRLLALTLLVPVVVVLGGDLDAPAEAPAAMALPILVVVLAAGTGLGLLLSRFGVPAALLLGGMFASSLLHGAGWVSGGVPLWLTIPGFLIMGTLIGTRFDETRWATLRKALGASCALTLISIVISLSGATLVASVTGLPVMQVLIAFSPGGVETMAAMAVLLDADPAFVAAHHVLRLFVLTALVPLILRLGRQDDAFGEDTSRK